MEDPSDVVLFQPDEINQSLLYENAECLSVRTYLRMCDIDCTIESRSNAQWMSPSGNVPFVRVGSMVVAEMSPIIDFFAKKGYRLTENLDEIQLADLAAHKSIIRTVLLNAEMYICWLHEPTVREVTKPRYGCVFTGYLCNLLPYLKQREMYAKLASFGWAQKTLNKVLEDINECCKVLSVRLGDQPFMFGDEPTDLDALVFGHLYTLLTTELPDIDVGAIIKHYTNLTKFCSNIERRYYVDAKRRLE